MAKRVKKKELKQIYSSKENRKGWFRGLKELLLLLRVLLVYF